MKRSKTVILVTARLKSQRLPLKAIRPIFGRPLVAHLIDRLKLVRGADGIVLCTSALSEDDPLEVIATQEKIGCFRGHPEDVLVRLTDAAKRYGADTVVSVTADNPFTDPVHIDELIRFQLEGGYDFSRVEGLPLGTYAHALSVPAMERACKIKNVTDTEMWGTWFTETGEFECAMVGPRDESLEWPDLRLTVDTPEDFALANEIFRALYRPGNVFSLEDIVTYLRARPELVAINRHVEQRKPQPLPPRAA